jgi:hypothetical protein
MWGNFVLDLLIRRLSVGGRKNNSRELVASGRDSLGLALATTQRLDFPAGRVPEGNKEANSLLPGLNPER